MRTPYQKTFPLPPLIFATHRVCPKQPFVFRMIRRNPGGPSRRAALRLRKESSGRDGGFCHRLHVLTGRNAGRPGSSPVARSSSCPDSAQAKRYSCDSAHTYSSVPSLQAEFGPAYDRGGRHKRERAFSRGGQIESFSRFRNVVGRSPVHPVLAPHGEASHDEPLWYLIRFPQEGHSVEVVQEMLQHPDMLADELAVCVRSSGIRSTLAGLKSVANAADQSLACSHCEILSSMRFL